MDKFATAMGGIFLVFAGIFFFVIFGTLTGAMAGWIVGVFFGDTILNIASQIGISNVSMWQLGAFLGFAGGFLKTKVSAEVKSK